jgi:hypothetical protein
MAPGGLQMRREDGPSHAGVLRGPRPPGARHSRGIKRKSLVAFLARAGKHPYIPDDSAPDIGAEATSN